MERDQERYYEAEDQERVVSPEQEQPAAKQPEEVNDMVFFLEALNQLRRALEVAKYVPLTNKKMIDADFCTKIINALEKNLPDAVQYGMKMFSEQERIMGEAEKEAMRQVSSAEIRARTALEKAKSTAEQIIADAENEAHAIRTDAEDRAEHMLQESEIVRRAHEEAREIKNAARVDAGELRLKVNHDAYQLLVSVEDQLEEAYKIVHRRRTSLGDDSK